jgi:hypothetical protein
MIGGADLELFERSLRHVTERHTGAELDAALADLGWADALSIDPAVAISRRFELQGAANATSAGLDEVVVDALGIDDAGGAVVLPALDRTAPPGTLAGDRVTVAGLGTAGLAGSDTVLVVARDGGSDVAVVVPTAALAVRVVEGLDPRLGLVEVTAEGIAIDAAPVTVDAWIDAVARAQLALGHELVGAARTMLAQAREHALERIQFGQPISQFQAVRHRLAETLVAIETAAAVLDAAWLDGSHVTAAMAKALAGRGARTAARHCQQVLAGIGFTTEHPLHLYIRRVLVLDELFGAARSLTRTLGDDLLSTRRLPPLLPL